MSLKLLINGVTFFRLIPLEGDMQHFHHVLSKLLGGMVTLFFASPYTTLKISNRSVFPEKKISL